MNGLNDWPTPVRNKIDSIVREARKIAGRAESAEGDECIAVEKDWQDLYERARQLYLKSIQPHMMRMRALESGDWDELERVQTKLNQTTAFNAFGPSWLDYEEDFEEYGFGMTCTDLGMDGAARDFAREFADLDARHKLTKAQRAVLKEYETVLNDRLKIVRGMLKG